MDNDGVTLISNDQSDGKDYPDPAQPQPIYLYAGPPPQSIGSIRENFQSTLVLIMGSIMVGGGVVAAIANVMAIGIVEVVGVHYVSHGVWIGAILVVSGALSIVAAKWRTTCMIVTAMVMCIMSCIFSIIMVIISVSAIESTHRSIKYGTSEYNFTIGEYLFQEKEIGHLVATSYTLDGIVVFATFVSLVSALTIAVCSCRSFMCCVPPSKLKQEPVQYNTSQQQIMLVAQGGTQGTGTVPVVLMAAPTR